MNYPFPDSPNTMTITCCHILERGAPILYASHDEEDGMWQFLCGEIHDVTDAKVVSLGEIFELDPSIAQLASMPCGFVAERIHIGADWMIRKNKFP